MAAEHSAPVGREDLSPFLADTCWFGLTDRISEKEFQLLVDTRSRQGFDALQVVMGIPPEVGAEHPAARGGGEAAWNLRGDISEKYVRQARERLEYIRASGMIAIIYGAWGHQIDWIGVSNMNRWWDEIIKQSEDLSPIYCLTGEADLWTEGPRRLLPDKATDDLPMSSLKSSVRKLPLVMPVVNRLRQYRSAESSRRRAAKWGEVLMHVRGQTPQPIICHTTPAITSEQSTNHPELLDALTVQTGHDPGSRNALWQLPYAHRSDQLPFINLEPWYEGIHNRFGLEDQLFAYWTSALAGSRALCYGAQGIWNGGDGTFLAHWGKTTFNQALQSSTAEKVGLSHTFLTSVPGCLESDHCEAVVNQKGALVKISRTSGNTTVTYVPDAAKTDVPHAETVRTIYDPLQGRTVQKFPASGQLVIVEAGGSQG